MSKWIPSWRYVPIDYNQEMGVLENVTQTAIFTNNIAGDKVKLRLCNKYNDVPMTVEHVALQVRNRVTGKLSPKVMVTLNGSETITLAPDTQVYSDEIPQAVTCEDDFVVTMYFGEKFTYRSVCTTSTFQSWQVSHQSGDFTKTEALGFTMKTTICPVLAKDPYPCHYVIGLSAICVHTSDDTKLIAMFGDSITHMSFVSDPFISELYRNQPGKYAVMNGGIAGNRLQKTYPASPFPGGGHQFGIAGKDRFREDVLEEANPDIVFIMIGVNDCSHSIVFREDSVPTAEDIYAALKQVTDEAHAIGAKVYITTITPFGAFGSPWRDQAEAIRCAYNDLIRSGKVGDDILDLDAIMRDPDDTHRMQAGMHLGDGVHPNWAGGTKMGRAIFEKWFKN